MKLFICGVGACCLFLTLFAMPVASAAPTIYEGFGDYADASEVLSTNGGTGFANHWQPRAALLGSGGSIPLPTSLELRPMSLSYVDASGNNLVTSGGSLFLTGSHGSVHLARIIDVSALPNIEPNPQTGTTTYISFLAQRTGPAADPNNPIYGGNYPWGDNLYTRSAGVNLFSNDGGDAVPLFIGGVSNSTEDVWRLRGQDLDGVNKDPLINEPFGEGAVVYLVVLRIDHGLGDGGADEINMYLNPLLASESLNTIGVAADWETRDDPLYLPADWLGLEAGDASSNRPHAELTFDEFRIGQTWEDVLPIVAVDPLAGDYNDDGTVDAADYTVWRDNLGSAVTLPHDTTAGTVDEQDYLAWGNNFGSTAEVGALSAAAVPESGTLSLFLTAAGCAAVGVWRRQVS